MNCNEYENLITEYLEETVSQAKRIEVKLHLSACEKCRTLAAQEKSVMEAVSKIPIEPCPDEVIDHVMQSISDPVMPFLERIRLWLIPGKPIRHRVASFAGAFAVVAMLLIIFITGLQKQTLEAQKYSPEEIQQAKVEAELALAYFSVYSQKAENALGKVDFDRAVVKPVEGELKKALGKIPYI